MIYCILLTLSLPLSTSLFASNDWLITYGVYYTNTYLRTFLFDYLHLHFSTLMVSKNLNL